MNLNHLKREAVHGTDTCTAQRLGGAALLAITLFAAACAPTRASTRTPPPKREVIADVACGRLSFVGAWYDAMEQNGSVASGFAAWAPVNGEPTSAVVTAEVPLDTITIRWYLGCGRTPKNWGINDEQSPLSLARYSIYRFSCTFSPDDLPSADMGTVHVADACRVTPEIPATAGTTARPPIAFQDGDNQPRY